MKKISLIAFLLILNVFVGYAQQPNQLSSAEIYQKIKKLNVLGNVLYLAAHPDDENTRFIAYSANEKLFNTSYLSLTRGDGGQNLIGTEIREELGIIRTQELLAARRTDGGKQYFSRANDFGYSKTPEETLEIWDKNKILSDLVWIIRKTKPDVIVCRFPTDGKGGHGHHTSSALLGQEAFELAVKEDAFPEQLKYVDTWQPKRIVVNTGKWWNDKISENDPGVVAEDIGLYNSVLGISYNELAANSRTMHKSQGFGSTGTRGEHFEFFEHLAGDEAQKSLFDDIDFSWSRVLKSDKIITIVQNIINQFNIERPENSISKLITLRKELVKIEDEFWKKTKIEEVDELIKNCAGLYLEAKSNDYYATPGDSVDFTIELVNRSFSSCKLISIESNVVSILNSETILETNKITKIEKSLKLPEDIKISQPYWLEKEGSLGVYNVENQELIGTPENKPSVYFEVKIDVEGEVLTYQIPLIYKWNDPVKGELYKPFVIFPPAFVNFSEEVQLFSTLSSKEIEVTVRSNTFNEKIDLTISKPNGWDISPSNFSFAQLEKGEEQKIKFTLSPTSSAVNGDLKASFNINGKVYGNALKTIDYDHIPSQVYMPKSKLQLVYVDLKTTNETIAYINGAGDKIAESLVNIGYKVDVLDENKVDAEMLKKYDVVILGIRALNTIERMEFIMPKLLQYSFNGGNLILQYNTSHRLNTKDFSPYPIKLSRDRVTEEDAQVTFLNPNHTVLNFPNKIELNDFDGWVQERGLYFPNEWDEKYDTILSFHDKNEDSKNGSLLITKYGKGYYTYTGLSFFRELPAAVPGAYRLFVNLISLNHGKTN